MGSYEKLSLNACFQSVVKASYVMKAARRALAHNHSCTLVYALLVRGDLAFLKFF